MSNGNARVFCGRRFGYSRVGLWISIAFSWVLTNHHELRADDWSTLYGSAKHERDKSPAHRSLFLCPRSNGKAAWTNVAKCGLR